MRQAWVWVERKIDRLKFERRFRFFEAERRFRGVWTLLPVEVLDLQASGDAHPAELRSRMGAGGKRHHEGMRA
jgi:hypothetical protein